MDASSVWHIFPGAGFESSILTIVLLGVLLRWALTEWFGFTFAGLIVPGYLASVLIIAPFSGAVIVMESLITYGIVWLLVDFFGDQKIWSSSFGRDRFFAFVLVSLFVRLTGELLLWPQAWQLMAGLFDLSERPPANLNSLGLVLVPLTANMFWKTGLWRGSVQVLMPTLVVWWVSAHMLLRWTNLRFSKFQVHYEAAAIDILATPKTYAIMLVGAAIAARTNLRYGWDFGGILIPALIALSFFEPGKVAISITEALVLAACVKILLERSPLRRFNLEGPRRIVLVFSVAYLIKYSVAWWMQANYPHLQVTDFFSFGYLLSSLLALKIIQRGAARVLIPTLVVSAASFIIGGLGAELLFEALRPQEEAIVLVEGGQNPESSQEEWRAREERALPRALLSRSPLLSEIEPARRVPLSVQRLDDIARYLSQIDSQKLTMLDATVRLDFPVERYGLEHVEMIEPSGRLSHLISEPRAIYPDQVGLGMLWLRPGATGPAIEVPKGGADPEFMAMIMRYALVTDARHVIFGARARFPYGAEVEPFGSIPSLFDHVHRDLSTRGDVVRVRRLPRSEDMPDAPSRLWSGARIGEEPFLSQTLTSIQGLDILWSYPEDFIASDVSGKAVLLEVSRRDVGRLADAVPGARFSLPGGAATRRFEDLEQVCDELLFGDPGAPDTIRGFARERMQLLAAPEDAEVEVVQRALLAPLLELAIAGHVDRDEPTDGAERNFVLHERHRQIAHALDLELRRIEIADGAQFYLISERGPRFRGWGAVLIRIASDRSESAGVVEPWMMEVPRPYLEESIWRLGAILAQATDARVLALGSRSLPARGVLVAEPMSTPGLLVATQRAWLDLFSRGQIRQGRSHRPFVLQLRGLAAHEQDARSDGGADFILSHERPFRFEKGAREGLLDVAMKRLAQAGIGEIELDIGQPSNTSLHGIPDLSAQLAAQLNDGRFLRLWVSERARSGLVDTSLTISFWERISSRLPSSRRSTSRSLDAWMRRGCERPLTMRELDERDALALATTLRRTIQTRNPLELERVLSHLEREEGLHLELLLDEADQTVWFVFQAWYEGAPVSMAIRGSESVVRRVVTHDVAQKSSEASSTRLASVLAASMSCEAIEQAHQEVR